MKIVTLNANSYCSNTPTKNMENLINVISESDFDVIAFQDNYIPCQDRVPIRSDNYLFVIEKALRNSGQTWYWTFLPIHVGWDIYDEGVGFLTKHPIRKTTSFYVSNCRDYYNIETRMALGIQLTFNGKREWFYSCHFDKWEHPNEPFDQQWNRFVGKACNTPQPLYVMGDFNNDANVKGKAYDYILNTSNLIDTFAEAEYHDNGITVGDYIAGWTEGNHPKEMRIDFIFTNSDLPILSSEVIFTIVSDHYGIEVTYGEKSKVFRNDKGSKLPEFSSEQVNPNPLTPNGSAGPLTTDK